MFGGGGRGMVWAEYASDGNNVIVLVGDAVLGMNPSCSHLRHWLSKSAGVTAGAPAEGAPASCGRFAGVPPAFSFWGLGLATVELCTRSLPLAVL